MKNLKPFYWIVLCLVIPFLSACKGDDPKGKTTTEMLIKNWRVRQVSVANQIVYSNPVGTTPNSQDFAAYRLNFTNATEFIRTEQNGNSTNGTWQLNESANPPTITFNTGTPADVKVESVTDDNLIISYIVNSPKTGTSEYRIEMIPAQ